MPDLARLKGALRTRLRSNCARPLPRLSAYASGCLPFSLGPRTIDEENAVSWNPKTDASEFFTSEAAAMKKASALADSEPGKTYYVCAATRFAVCKVHPATVQYIK